MKNFAITIALFLTCLYPQSGFFKVFSDRRVVDSASDTSIVFPIDKAKGFFSLECRKSKNGKAKVLFQVSNTCSTFVVPSSASNIYDSLVGTTADLISFSPPVSRCMRFILTELTGDTSLVNCWLWGPL